MGQRTNHPGVEEHRGKLRVVFQYKGARCRETLNLQDTPSNRAKVSRLRAEIVRKINLGTFDYAEFFPDSRRVIAEVHTFKAVAQEWLNLQGDLAKSTIESYEQMLNTHWMDKLGRRVVTSITPGQVKKAVQDCDFQSIKTRNNATSVLRMVFNYAVGEKYIKESPAAKIEHLQIESKEPDPYSYEEMTAVLDWMRKNSKPGTYNYFRFAFATGMRTSELLQIQWPKIDFRRKLARVDEAYVRGQVKTTKTRKRRDIELTAEAIAALQKQKAETYLAGAHVFVNPNTGDPYYNQQAPGLAMKACLKSLGIRHRPAYNTRHTFATLNLMSGANPYWVSKQLGHASLEVTLKTYAHWIANADHGRERSRVESYLKELSLGANAGA